MASSEARHLSSLRRYGRDYAADLQRLMTLRKLPPKWITHSPDHLGFLAISDRDYEQRLERLQPLAENIIEVEENGQRSAAVSLETPLAIDVIGQIGTVEINQVDSKPTYKHQSALDHVQFQPVNLQQIRSIFKVCEVGFTETSDEISSWIDVPVSACWVARFSDRPLAQALEHKLNSKRAKRL